MSRPDRRRGFVLLTVLWVLVGVSVVGVTFELVARRSVRAAANRMAETRADWRAKGCLARARAAIDGALADTTTTSSSGLPDPWRALDEIVAAASRGWPPDCRVTAVPTGLTLDVNTATEDMLHRLLAALGVPPQQRDSIADAILDWRDADTLPRPHGAEADWYRARHLPLPRNGPFADPRELLRVRGIAGVPGLETLLGVDPGRIDLNRAPPAVLSALPGITPELVARLEEDQRRGTSLPDLLALGGEGSPASRAALMDHEIELERLTTTEPDAWILTIRARDGVPPITVALEERLVHAGTRAAVQRRRTWLE